MCDVNIKMDTVKNIQPYVSFIESKQHFRLFFKRLKLAWNTIVIPLRWCVLSFPSVSAAAPRRSLRGRLRRLDESDRQMCHQVNQSDCSSDHSWAYCPCPRSATPCYCLFPPSLSFPSPRFTSLCPLSVCVLLFAPFALVLLFSSV